MKIAILGDAHFGARGNSLRFHEFFDKFYGEVFFPYLKEHGIDTIIQMGDLWDSRKQVGIQTVHLARGYFFDRLVANNIKMVTLLGNHDIVHRNSLDANSSSVLLDGYKDNITIIDYPTNLTFGNSRVLIVPWICESNKDVIEKAIKETTAEYCCGHFELTGFDMFRGQPAHDGQEITNLEKFKLVLSGHFHHRSRKRNIVYVGTPYEMNWQDFGDLKGFNILDTETGELEFVPNPYVMYQRIVYDEDKDLPELNQYRNCYIKVIVQNKKDLLKFESFMDNLQLAGCHDIKIIEDEYVNIDNTSVDVDLGSMDTMSLVNAYIDEMQTSLDKDAMKKYLNGLYLEAITEE